MSTRFQSLLSLAAEENGYLPKRTEVRKILNMLLV